jgi:hypothetical protein
MIYAIIDFQMYYAFLCGKQFSPDFDICAFFWVEGEGEGWEGCTLGNVQHVSAWLSMSIATVAMYVLL